MSNLDKNIVITPGVGSSTDDPKIVFSAANTTANAQNITMRAYPTSNGTLSVEGSAGQLFSITNQLTGTLFSVNDISGIPSISVLDTGRINLAQYNGTVNIGGGTTITSDANIAGNLTIGGTLYVAGNTIIENINITQYSITTNDTVIITNTTPAVSNTTGALQVSGGISNKGAIYSTGGSITINNGLATTGNSGTIFLGDGAFTKTYGSGWTFPGSGVTSGSFTTTGTGYQSQLGSNTQVSYGVVGYNGTGIYFPNTGVVGFAANSANALFVSAPTNSVNFLQLSGGTTFNTPLIQAIGTDSSVGITYNAKNVGPHYFNGAGGNQFVVQPVYNGSASVNWIQAQGNSTANTPLLIAQGSDTNVSLTLQSKGNSAINFATANGINLTNGGFVTSIVTTSNGGGYPTTPTITFSTPTNNGGVTATANAYVGLWSATLSNAGSGYTLNDVITFVGGVVNTDTVQYQVTSVNGTGAILTTAIYANHYGNYWTPPTSPASVSGGTGTGASFSSVTWTVYGINLLTSGSGYVEQPTVTIGNGGGSPSPVASAYAVVGNDSNIKSLGTRLNIQGVNGGTIMKFDGAAPGTAASTPEYLYVQNTQYGRMNFLASGSTNAQLWLGATGAGYINFSTRGTSLVNQFRITDTASAVNWLQVSGGTTGSPTTMTAVGSDNDVSITIASKGLGVIKFNSANGTNFVAADSGATTNYYWQAIGGQFNGILRSLGSTQDGLIQTAGTGGILFQTNNGAQTHLKVSHTASVVNYLQATGSTTGTAVSLTAQGSDANVAVSIASKGSGILYLGTSPSATTTRTEISAGGSVVATFASSSGRVNYIGMSAAASGSSPTFIARSSTDTNVGLLFGTFNDGNIDFSAGGDPNAGTGKVQFRVAPNSAAVNYAQVTGNTTGGGPTISGVGSDSSVDLNLNAQNTGSIKLRSGGAIGLEVYNSGGGGQGAYWKFGTNFSGSNPVAISSGSSGTFSTSGAGNFQFYTNTVTSEQFRILHTASSINFPTITGASGGGYSTLSTSGSDTYRNLRITTSSGGSIDITRGYNSAVANSIGMGPVGGLTTDTAAGFWRGLHLYAPNYTDSSGNFQFPRTSQYFEFNTFTNPTVRNYFYTLGNVTVSNTINFIISNSTGGDILFNGQSGNSNDVAFKIVPANVFTGIIHANYIQVTGGAAGSGPSLSAQGSDPNAYLLINSKGNGDLVLRGGTAGWVSLEPGGYRAFAARNIGVAVNYLTVWGSVTSGNNTTLSAVYSSDANVAINLVPKGNAAVMITGNTTGIIAAANSIYVGDRVGYANANNISVVYQSYNSSTNSLDVIFG